MFPRVYLAGPVAGLSYSDCTRWRAIARDLLANHGIAAVDPMRGKQDLADETCVRDHYENLPQLSEKAIYTRDFHDVLKCDAVLANLQIAEVTGRVSIGTVMEIGWASVFRKPIVVVMTETNPHNHAFIRQASWLVVDDLHEAIRAIATLFEE